MHIVCNFPKLLHTQYADVRLMCIGRRRPSYDVYSLAIGSNSQQLAATRTGPVLPIEHADFEHSKMVVATPDLSTSCADPAWSSYDHADQQADLYST